MAPILEQKAWPHFQRGEYDVAVFQAFKAVEVAVRQICNYEKDLIGINLMRKAFHLQKGPLTDRSIVEAEQQAMLDLFAGAIGHAKNPQSHREKPISFDESARLLIFASYLMDIIEERALFVKSPTESET